MNVYSFGWLSPAEKITTQRVCLFEVKQNFNDEVKPNHAHKMTVASVLADALFVTAS